MTHLCPICKSPVFFCLDEWGYTPWHLHCENCDINIGATNQKIAINLLETYSTKNMWIEYYGGDIQILCVDGKMIKDNTRG